MDADDIMLPDRLGKQTAALDAHPEWDVVACQVRYASHCDTVRGEGMRRYVAWLNTLRVPEQIRAARFIDAPVRAPFCVFSQDGRV